MSRYSFKSVYWPNGLFLFGTFFLALSGVPSYLWHQGLSAFQLGLFVFFFVATGLSITLGYHRLFSHLTFQAAWPVRMLTLVFGAAAFENSALVWAADHRRHHKYVDHDEDPYDISKGFFYAHVGWMLFSPPRSSFEMVKDLQQDKWVSWQHRHYVALAVFFGLVLPALLGLAWDGWRGAVGGFLMAGVARVVMVHHFTFFINSWSHTWGRRPYSSRCTARDNGFLAWLTFGEGYHNFHHAFQHDYRNGVKPWQFDPTKWTIWLLHKAGLAYRLRRVPDETILLAEISEQQRQLGAILGTRPLGLTEPIRRLLQAAQEQLDHASAHWEQRQAEYRRAAEIKMEASREKLAELRAEFSEAARRLRLAMRDWHAAYRIAQAQLA